jgi:negative regulator of flagellin synthesis FlgM|tara:strand:+ start:758 stop:1108 length:351 start_codon:yes stop_codon:yes gene_type:complete
MNNINSQYQGSAAGSANKAQAKSSQKTQDVHQQSQASQNQRTTEQTKAAPSQGADQAKFTPESQTLLRLTQASKGVSEIDQKKVDRIKQALENGEFPIDTARIAEKMTSLEKLIQG